MARSSKPGVRSRICSSSPGTPSSPALSGAKRASWSSRIWVFWSLFTTQAGGAGAAMAGAARAASARAPARSREAR
ncbi:MAG TPA: hypothetical protein VLB76_09555 [Thermoanaerobaculia bacterium]|nr:hypothetical protein [Thermoanaerobaculia bacterium]